MSEKKYYTPELSEFHVGFEFELYRDIANRESYWQKIIMDKNWRLNDWGYGLSDISAQYIRVKLLDAQDIEGCGWKETRDQYSRIIYSITCYSERDNGDAEIKFVFMSLTNHCIIYNGETNLFCGTIRNKNELQMIMRMTGIAQK